MPNTRRRYDEEFKKRAVELSYSEGRTVSGTAESLGISVSILHRWRKQYTSDGDKTKMASQQEELARLRRKNAELMEENEILKKASAYFAKTKKDNTGRVLPIHGIARAFCQGEVG